MKKALISLVAVLLSFSLAVRADSGMEDLPTFDPNAGSNDNQGSLPPLPPPPAAPNTPNAPVTPASEAGTLRIQGISRASGGTVYLIQVSPATSLQRIAVRVNGGNVVISSAIVNARSRSFSVRNLVSPDVLGAGARMTSETLNQGYEASSIELRMEAYGGPADVTVSVVADRGVPNLSLGSVVAPVPPVPPPTAPGNGANGKLSVGSRVMDAGESLGYVQEIFANGKVKVKFDGYSELYTRDANGLAVAVKCAGNQICGGARIIDGETRGYVKEVFSNGKATVTYDGYSTVYVRTAGNLSLATRCVQNICEGVRIMDSGENMGYVKEVFSNGKATVKYDGYSDVYTRTAANLSLNARCMGSICTGDRFIDSSNYTGLVIEIFSNAKAVVKYDGYNRNYVRSVSGLYRKIR